MSDILDEIISDDKDARRIYYFQKFFIPVIIAASIVACCIAGYGYYRFKVEEHNKEITDLLMEVLHEQSVNGDAVIHALDAIISNSDNHARQLAQIKLATEYIHKDMKEKASEILEGIIEDKGLFEITTAYARLLMMNIILDSDDVDDAACLKVSNLMNYFSDASHPFFATATLLKANFYMKIGQKELAEKYANEVIALRSAHVIIRDQAAALLAMLKYLQ